MKFKYELIDFFDDNTENIVKITFGKKLKQGNKFEINHVTYLVEDVDYWPDQNIGKAVIRMVRYKIPNTATQFVHKCPAKKKAMEKLSRDDVVKIEKKYGKSKAEKKIKQWKTGRAKMNTHNKLESRCPMCECIFWKEKNEVPETVVVDGVMHKKRKKK